MSLIKTTDELKKYISVEASLDIETILPDIKWAEKEYIVKYLGKAQYEDLHTRYNEDNLPEDQKPFLEILQDALANLAYAKNLAIGQVSISNSGIRIQTDDNYKTAFQWQVDGVGRYFLSKGFSGLEWLLEFLEENASTYTLWKNSQAYTVFKKYFINSAADFSEHYGIGGHRHTYLALVPVMKKIEEFTFIDVLSEPFYDALKTEIAAAAVSTDNSKLLRYLKPALAHLTIAKAIPELALELDGQGVRINQIEAIAPNANSKKQAPDTLLTLKMSQAYSDGMAYLNKLIDYLNTNASPTKYTAYYQNVILPKQTAAEQKPQPGSIYNGL